MAEAAAPSDSLVFGRRVQIYLLTYVHQRSDVFIISISLILSGFRQKTTVRSIFTLPWEGNQKSLDFGDVLWLE